MLHSRASLANLAVVAMSLCMSPVVLAFNVDVGVGAGLGYTDNAALTSTNEQDDWIVEAAVASLFSQSSGSFAASAEASFSHQIYLNDTYGDQDYFDLNGVADWEQVEDRLAWRVRNVFTQTPVNSLDPETPDNTQNANVFNFGPDIFFRASPRHSITISPQFWDYYYEDSDASNQQYGVNAGWLYSMYPTMDVGLEGAVIKTSYDNEDLNPGYTISNIYAFMSGSRPHSQYNIRLGAVHIDRDRFDNDDGFSGRLVWRYGLTGKSSVRAFVVSDLTDASTDFFNSEVDQDAGDFTSEQISGDVLRNNTMRLTYFRQGDTLNTELSAVLRDLDYKESPNDRKVQAYGASLGYRIAPLVTTGIDGRYTRTRQTDLGLTDKEYSIGGNLAYWLSRKLRCDLNVRYRNKDSTNPLNEFNEVSVYTGIVYGSERLSIVHDAGRLKSF